MRSAESAGSVSIFDGPTGALAASAADETVKDSARDTATAARRMRMETPSGKFNRRAWILARAQNPFGRSPRTPNAFSSAIPARPIVPSSKSRPISVTPWGTRRFGENFASGRAGSGAQSLRA